MGLDPLTVVCPLSATPASNQRRAQRFGVGLPYTLDGQEGQTRDLSATGLSFESDTAYPIGTIIDLTLRYGLDGHNFPLQCQVEVIRVEPEGQRYNIAARLCRPFFPPDA